MWTAHVLSGMAGTAIWPVDGFAGIAAAGATAVKYRVAGKAVPSESYTVVEVDWL
jgi:hypothetical protein